MCDAKKCEKILRSGLIFVGAKSDAANSIESVIWCDGESFTYWQAAAAILKEANDLLRGDLEQIGVKISSVIAPDEKEKDSVNRTTNKSMFHFEDTVNSLLIAQSQRGSQFQTTSQTKTDNESSSMPDENDIPISATQETKKNCNFTDFAF